MSVSICFVAKTGVVLGTDSRVTARSNDGETREDAYPKLVPFCDLPVALAMTGCGSYGARDFRALVAESRRAWRKSREQGQRVQDVAQVFADTVGEIARQHGATTAMSVMVGGYSPDQPFGELWEVTLPEGKVTVQAKPGSNTFAWRGQTEAILALWWGANLSALRAALRDAGVDEAAAKKVEDSIKAASAWGPQRINWGMPLSSAVDLIRLQLQVQIQYERFMPGRGRCGEPTQIVAINDSGLHWIDRPFPQFDWVGSGTGT